MKNSAAMLAPGQFRWILPLLVGATYCAAQAADNRSSEPTFRTSVSEVRVTFFVTEGNSRPLDRVDPGDFAVVDNGTVVRKFRSFGRSDETSLDIIALLDISESVAPRFRAAIHDVLQMVSREQSVPDDHVSVLSFGGLHPAILCSSSCRTTSAANQLRNVRSGGLTPLYDGLIFGADFVSHRRRSGVRPVLILFSDGTDTISLHSAREAMEAAVASGAVIYSVDIATPPNVSDGVAFLRWISDATGGRYFSIREGVAAIVQGILDDLRASYVVTYELPKQAGFHSLRLMPTHNLNLKFHNRSGYTYASVH